VVNEVAKLLYHSTYLSLLPSLFMLPPPLPTSSSASVSKFARPFVLLARPFVLHEHITSYLMKADKVV